MDYYINNCNITIQTYIAITHLNQRDRYATINDVIYHIKRQINRSYGLPPKAILIGNRVNATSTRITKEHFEILKKEFPELLNI